jgi:hypothetical protein
MENTKNKPQRAIHSLQQKSRNGVVIAIVLAKEWFKQWYTERKMPYFIPEDSFVVCKWFDFHDGIKSNIEARQTIAICKNENDAEKVYEANCV